MNIVSVCVAAHGNLRKNFQAVYMSYPGQYECLDCCHGKTKPTIKTIISKDAKIVSVTKDPDDKNFVIVGYRRETKNSGIIFCPLSDTQKEKND